MTDNITLVWNAALKKLVMVIVDAENLSDPSWCPENCILIPTTKDIYKNFATIKDAENFAKDQANLGPTLP